jgi:hypothetical protein
MGEQAALRRGRLIAGSSFGSSISIRVGSLKRGGRFGGSTLETRRRFGGNVVGRGQLEASAYSVDAWCFGTG